LTSRQAARTIRHRAIPHGRSFVEENTMRMLYFAPRLRLAALAGLFVALFAPAAWCDEARIAINGYDPVAYFTDGAPVRGTSDFEHVWHNARWYFANAAHRDLFIADPEHYAPQYDGFCAMGASLDKGAHKDTVDPQAWSIINGKLYLTHTVRALDRWRQNTADNIQRADEKWAAVKNQPEPVIVGVPCRDKPASVVISLDDGKRRVLVGGQVALADDGKVVGEGDMRAQIEQVGKNVQACLQAAGASSSDIILTRAYVTDTDAFKQNADMRASYLGPESPTSTVNTLPKLAAGPDFMVEIEAVANLNSPSAASAGPKQ
jgi:enamine deaminase RidA (YjgF/YER057c/UK114 family)